MLVSLGIGSSFWSAVSVGSRTSRTLRARGGLEHLYSHLTCSVSCALCVFRGGWTAGGAEAVCEESLALDMLAQLRECSLVSTQGE